LIYVGVECMAKKAKLDTLEIASDGSDEAVPKDNELSSNDGNDASTEIISKGGYLSKATGWFRRPLLWIILILVGTLGSSAFIWIVYDQGSETEVIPTQNKKPILATRFPEGERGPLIEGMVIDQKDISGNIRVIFCDVALDFEYGESAIAINSARVDVRSVIYSVLQKGIAEEGLSPEGRKRLKEKLKNELNALFREKLVKEVYFTRYELN
jgi:flagellar basal body-associated protein FliL